MRYKDDRQVFYETDFFLTNGEPMPLLTFSDWDELTGIRHCFTTREGGVSEGYLSSLSFRKNDVDTAENLYENFRRIAEYFDTTPDNIVAAHQTHTKNVRCVTAKDAGKGVIKERDYSDIDALITDVPGIVLFTSHADCVPVYFYDPVKRVIALAHSGWRGTVNAICGEVIDLMKAEYGCSCADIRTAIGPSICGDCYEVSEDVAEELKNAYAGGGFEGEISDCLRDGRARG